MATIVARKGATGPSFQARVRLTRDGELIHNDGSYGLDPADFGNFSGVTAQDGIRWVAGWSSFDERFGQSHCRECSEACRRCADECRRMTSQQSTPTQFSGQPQASVLLSLQQDGRVSV